MPRLKALNSILLYCRDLKASAEFYRKLGLSLGREKMGVIPSSLGDLTIQLLDQNSAYFQQDAQRKDKGVGVFLEIEVENVDAYHSELIGKGLKPSSTPRDWPWGKREFAIKDPDGYRIVLYSPLPSTT